MRTPKKRLPCFICAVVLAALAAAAPGVAQKSHDALARARQAAEYEGQRVLLLLRGEESRIGAELEAALGSYRDFGKLLKFEYQLAAQPAESDRRASPASQARPPQETAFADARCARSQDEPSPRHAAGRLDAR